MKDSRFIELLNLYIDRQITAAETAELEAEIQRQPKRQAIYRQYCQIHTATKVVYESFRTVAAEQPVPAGGPRGVVERFETRRRRTAWAYYGGGAAVAACLALVFLRPGQENSAASGSPVLAAVTPPAIAVNENPVAPAESASRAEPGLVSLRNSATTNPDYAAMLTALREQDEERAFYTERLHIDRIQPLFNDDMFDSKRALTAQEARIFRSQPTPTSAQQQAESAAFQFIR